MKNHLHVIVIVLISLCLFGSVDSASAVDIVRDGKPAAGIVIPDAALPVVQYAAQELQYHLRQATGATVGIVAEKNQPAGGEGLIYLGPCRKTREVGISDETLAPNAFVLKTVGKDLFIVGKDADGPPLRDDVFAGTLFGVYELLEKNMGVRWLWPGKLGEVIPSCRDMRISSLNETVTRQLLHTRLRCGGEYGGSTLGWSSSAARGKYMQDQAVWLRRHRFARGISLEYGHGFESYWGQFSKSHPDFFNLLPNGLRVSDPMYFGGPGRLISMCVSNSALWRQIVDDWQKTRAPFRDWINCAEDDTCGKCTCDRCLAWDAPDPTVKVPFDKRRDAAREAFLQGKADWYDALGSVSDRYAKFFLAVQKEAQKVDPQVTVLGYAYANYNKPPIRTKLNDHIVLAVVPALMYPWTDEKRAAFRTQWEGWSSAGARLYLRPNYFLDGHDLPIFIADKFGEDFSFAYKRGMIATDFDSLTGQWATQGPNLYVLARVHTRGDWPVSKILDEYYQSFGPAAGAVRTYFEHWKQISATVTDEMLAAAAEKDPGGGSWARFYRIAESIFTPKVMADGARLLEKAKADARGDAQAEQRVAFLEKGLKNAELTLAAQRGFTQYKEKGDLQAYRSAVARLDAFRAEVEGDDIANMGYLAWAEGNTWDRSFLKIMSTPGQPVAETWKLMWDPSDQGQSKGWQAADVDVSTWQDIRVDDFYGKQEAGKKWAQEHGRDYTGIVWYRTAFSVKPENKSKQVRLIFGAVDEACKIWVNGKLLLDRPYPYRGNKNSWQEAFEVDITRAVRFDRPNSLAVRVQNKEGAGGIWRPVYLVTSDLPVKNSSNVISNPGFEEGTAGWPTNRVRGDLSFAIDNAVSHTGKASARITCSRIELPDPKEGNITAWGRWYRTDIPVQPGQAYRLRLWVKTSNDFTGTVNVWPRPGIQELRILSTEGLWKELVLEPYRSTQSKAALYLNLTNGKGTVWFDDVELCPIKGK